MNNSSKSEPFMLQNVEKVALISAYCLVSIIGIPGNISIFFIFLRKKKRYSSGTTFIISLAFSDLMASIFIPVVMIHDLVNLGGYSFGSVGCKLLSSMNILTTLASAWNLVLISLDRLRVIYYPFEARLAKTKRIISVLTVWSVAFLVTLPYTLHLRLGTNGCWPKWKHAKHEFLYIIVYETSTCVLPTLIMITAYTMAAKKLKESQLNTENYSILRRLKQIKKVTRLFILMVLVFIILTFPYLAFMFTFHYLALYDIQSYYRNHNLLNTLNYGLFAFSLFNSTVNCFIYAKMYFGIRKTVSKISQRFSVWSNNFRRDSSLRLPFELKMLRGKTMLEHIDCCEDIEQLEEKQENRTDANNYIVSNQELSETSHHLKFSEKQLFIGNYV